MIGGLLPFSPAGEHSGGWVCFAKQLSKDFALQREDAHEFQKLADQLQQEYQLPSFRHAVLDAK